MKRKVCFIHRKHADTPSIERVFGILARELEKQGIEISHVRLPFGNGLFGMLANLLFFRVPEADILHITGHIHYIALKLPADKTVLTVHDLGILRNRNGLRLAIIKRLFVDWPVGKLRHITAISNATKLEIITHTNCDPTKIVVINDPLDPEMKGGPKKFDAEIPVILQIGTAPHKNLERLIEAVIGMSCRLIIVGKLEDRLIEILKQNQIDYESEIADTDSKLRSIFEQSDIMAFCSTFEGFGLPIIEAQSMGIPVITSDLEPMNDVASAGAVLVDPNDASHIRKALEKLINDREFRDDIVAKGRENCIRFESSKIAAEYLRFYEKIFPDN